MSMKMYMTSNCVDFEQLASEWTEERVIVHVAAGNCVWTGRGITMDRLECKRRGLPIGQGEYLGGTIVCMPGDLSICIATWGNSEAAPRIVDRVSSWLEDRGIGITYSENDILVEDKKVISWARATTLAGWCQSVVHFSVGPMDLELVKSICTKPMKKEPGSLGNYGITAEDILAAITPHFKEVLAQ